MRWANHVRKAFAQPWYNHGLYNALRKYGPSAFTVEIIAEVHTKQEAQKLERKLIAQSDPDMLYNISPGGEADGEFASKKFWDSLNADPAAKAAYIARLSKTKLSADWTDYDSLAALNAQWRKENPKEAYHLARRGTRIANRNQPKRAGDTRSLKERLLWKHKRGEMVGRNTTEFWRKCPADKKAEIVDKVRSAAREQWERVTDPVDRSRLTEKARSSIDRAKQGAAASAGIKRWWAELKADPVRYAEYIDARKASLLKTLEGKK